MVAETKGVKLTEREAACLRYLSPLMDATPEMIGRAVMPSGGTTKRGRVTVGNRVADGLAWRAPEPPLVAFLGNRLGYAITPAGRSALAAHDGGQDGT